MNQNNALTFSIIVVLVVALAIGGYAIFRKTTVGQITPEEKERIRAEADAKARIEAEKAKAEADAKAKAEADKKAQEEAKRKDIGILPNGLPSRGLTPLEIRTPPMREFQVRRALEGIM